MGDATRQAYDELLSHKKAFQQATVLVKDPSRNQYFRQTVDYKNSDSVHVEQFLLAAVCDEYGVSFEKLPNNSTIIIVGRWSPCRRCTKTAVELIHGHKFNNPSRNVKVKYRFMEYYTDQNWKKATNGKSVRVMDLLWNSDKDAIDTYFKLSLESGARKILRSTEIDIIDDEVASAQDKIEVSNYLVFRKLSPGNSRNVWIENQRLVNAPIDVG